MRKSLISLVLFFAITGLIVNSQTLAQTSDQPQGQAQAQTKAPNLPDYTKEPWRFFTKLSGFGSYNHQEWGGELHGDLYADAVLYSKARNPIMIILNDDDSPRYAEWIEMDENAKKLVCRGYNYKDGKWIYDKEYKFE